MPSIIKDKPYSFSLQIIRLHQYLSKKKREFDISRQLLRSGTSIGALVREAQMAESRKDFIHKMTIALKEANESEYWIELLIDSGYIEGKSAIKLKEDNIELIKILVTIIKTSKKGL